ncbi:hypothetical protein D3C76_1660140 [compost metagenome]
MLVAALGAEELFDHVVGHWIGDARIVLAAFHAHLAGVEVEGLFQARAQGLWQGHQDHVVVEVVQALLVLGAIHRAQACVDADAGEVLDVGLEDAFKVRVDQ